VNLYRQKREPHQFAGPGASPAWLL